MRNFYIIKITHPTLLVSLVPLPNDEHDIRFNDLSMNNSQSFLFIMISFLS